MAAVQRETGHPYELLLHFFSGHFSHTFFVLIFVSNRFYTATFIGFSSALLVLKCSLFVSVMFCVFLWDCVSTFNMYVSYMLQ